MFYVKETVSDSMDITIEINDENVFCKCPRCGDEVQVDLQEILSDGDLFGTSVFCERCSKKMRGGN